jgi:small membrane protein
MLQKLIAIIIILYFIARVYWQKKKNQISINEYYFWMFFWFLTFLAIIFIKKIDNIVASLGFSSSGINVLFYIGVVILFYFIFRLRLKIEKMERTITKIIRDISLNNKE